MKKLMLVFVAVALVMSLFALAQYTTKPGEDQTKQDNMKSENTAKKAVSISGKVSDDGKTIVGDKDNKTWKVSNPDTLKGHEGHHVTVKAHVDIDKDEIHVTSVKMAEDKMKDTMKKDEMKK
jgi:membrane protein implicated in regulation of membrane protease activity